MTAAIRECVTNSLGRALMTPPFPLPHAFQTAAFTWHGCHCRVTKYLDTHSVTNLRCESSFTVCCMSADARALKKPAQAGVLLWALKKDFKRMCPSKQIKRQKKFRITFFHLLLHLIFPSTLIFSYINFYIKKNTQKWYRFHIIYLTAKQ